METIFALSSGALPSGVAVIRISGTETKAVLSALCQGILKPRVMHYRTLKDGGGDIIDNGLVVFFKGPQSFTGEDCAELHIHGGRAVVQKLLDVLGAFPNCRQAEAGEFARRAFAEGKLDLTEAEGLADLIEAETESQRKLALMGASGALAELYRNWRKELIFCRAMIEAELDFADESDVPGSVSNEVWQRVSALKQSIEQHIEDGKRANIMRDGLRIVIAGAPNAGKSSLINRLAGRKVAIVTNEAGTTRDALEVRLVISGVPVLITDTAGLRKTDNHIEKAGIEIAEEHILTADLVLMLEDMQNPTPIELPKTEANIWHIGNKLDYGEGEAARWPLQISAATGENWQEFIDRLEAFCSARAGDVSKLVPARKRQVSLLVSGMQELEYSLVKHDIDLELRAEHLRLAANAIGRITGDVDVEDLLDVIFSEFCVGK
ncbi:tRNA uridine-5-carboxymethylaminomethyl(34) synthesis GTPase MnmE [Bartonella sp. HY761]|uniref:tRNA uridine-5-carboxymethylaminomethyl(34) synthesis GTPase MnmE n=1 Tax=Bartonella sp. HY761 TaxID=2979330 RepID=UPI00220C9BDE|nr:tRNA uridine-5-carboxymethylaminomethyl(34) synthesis GTPase MnmE [Bartonella sp. HY761]UXN06246.1 tRNA uridine-5-carboxymethylaminomethyl(34) synthesis GTPase MnmE [Bartonella sp. HY761]